MKIRKIALGLKIALILSSAPRLAGEWLENLSASELRLVGSYEALMVTGDAAARLESAFEYAKYFLPFVRERIAARNLPPELAFLPIIESGYNPNAVSPSGATGIWQFMENTREEYGLARTEILDERRDFWASTDAALDKLTEDYERFSDWYLALAAYNCGTTCVRKAIERTGVTDYWELARLGELPAGTIGYVPKLLAVLMLVERADEIGYGEWSPFEIEWRRIRSASSVHLGLILKKSGIESPATILANAALIVQTTPADGTYHLKVPSNYSDIVSRYLNDPEVAMSDYTIHRIAAGDTLSSLAARYSVKVSELTSLNPGIRAKYLQINSFVLVPTFAGEGSTVHVVQSGDTLWDIAQRYRVSVEELLTNNSIADPDTIQPGLTLVLPAGALR